MATGKLRQVELDAIRIQTKRFNDQFEEMKYQAQLDKEQNSSKEEDEQTNEDESEESDKKGK